MSQYDNETQAAIDAGLAQAEPRPIGGDGRFWSVTTPAGAAHQVVDVEELLDKYRNRPRRKTGSVVVHDVDSFVAYFEKHGRPESELYAALQQRTVVAVINAHGESLGRAVDADADQVAGWGDHRATLRMQLTPEWQAWAENDRAMVAQVVFAEHIEDHAADIIDPPAADMLEIAQTLSVHRDVKFDSSTRLSTGERKLSYKEQDEAKAGNRGGLTIPERFSLGLRPFEGGEAYRIEARLRYRIVDGALLLGYCLDRADEVLRNAFNDVRQAIAERTDATVLAGEPAASPRT